MIFSHPETRMSRKGTMKFMPPALLTTMSSCPSSRIASWTAAVTSSWRVTSSGKTKALRPSSVTWRAVSASPSWLRAARATSAPAAASATAMTRPIPRDAPVTNAFFPVRSNAVTFPPTERYANTGCECRPSCGGCQGGRPPVEAAPARAAVASRGPQPQRVLCRTRLFHESYCVGSVIVGGTSAAGLTRRTISVSAMRT
jgi:hypothetical protein